MRHSVKVHEQANEKAPLNLSTERRPSGSPGFIAAHRDANKAVNLCRYASGSSVNCALSGRTLPTVSEITFGSCAAREMGTSISHLRFHI